LTQILAFASTLAFEKPMAARSSSDKIFFALNALVSLGAVSFLAWLLLLHKSPTPTESSLRFLPAVNAGFNGFSALLLSLGFWAIKQKRVALHRLCMTSAFASSSLFLCGYIAYHAIFPETKYGETGVRKGLYLALLASHVLLSLPIVPLALTAFYFALRERFASHKKVTRVLLPIWLYVSVTGVLVYSLLRPFYP
jgi:putative membrane protein